MDLYDHIAPFYRMEMDGYEDDLPFLRNLAGRTGGPVLDVGTGDGRVAFALADAGHDVVGLDSSAVMIDLAQRQLQARKPLAGAPGAPRGHRKRGPRGSVSFVQGDMRDFGLGREFSLILLAAGTFTHLTTRHDQEQALGCFRAHLTSGGLLAVTLQNPYQWALDQKEDELVLGSEKDGPGPGETTRISYAARSDRAKQLRHVRVWYDVTGPDKVVRRTGAQFSLRWTYQPELALLFEGCGLRPEAWYGSYDLDPYDTETPLLIGIAHRD